MSPRRLLSLAFASSLLVAVLMGSGIISFPSARALPPGGLDVFNVTAEVDVTSRLGVETVPLTGTVTIVREDPHLEGDVEVEDLELTAMQLEGDSLIGHVVVTESPTVVSAGELRSLQPDEQFPASMFINAFVNVTIPANPSPTLVLHNNQPLRLVSTAGGEEEAPLDEWPPLGVTFALDPIFGVDNDGDTAVDEDTADDDGDGLIDEDRPGPDPDTPGAGFECGDNADCDDDEGEDPPANLCPPASNSPTLCDQDGDGEIDEDPDCVPLMNSGNTHMKAGVCIRDTSITIGAAKTPTPTMPVPASEGQTLSVAPNGPSGLHPAALLEFATGGPTGPVQVSGNDNFANAHQIPGVPFTGLQTTGNFTVETGEPVELPSCLVVPPNQMGRTAWYRYTAPAGGTLTIDTEGSDFDTTIAIYTGSALDALSLVGCDDDSGSGLLSAMTVPVVGGTIYRIQAGGFNAESGDLQLNVTGPGGAGEASTPSPRIPCTSLGLSVDGCDLGVDGDQDDVDALAFGGEFPPDEVAYAFSVAPGSLGTGGTAVGQQAACSPAQPQADEFTTALLGTNALLFDGDGVGPACPTADPIGFIETPLSDDLDAMEAQPPSYVDEDGNGALDGTVYFSLALGSPSLATLGRNAAEILWANGGPSPGLYASSALLGLNFGDDLDALCVTDRGTERLYEAGIDTVFFSLAAGSPTLADQGLSASDILRPGPQRVHAASLLGLRTTDDLDALSCFDFDAPPVTPTPTGPAGVVGDANCSGSVNSIDATIVLQDSAGLTNAACPLLADVNQDGSINSLDAALILQFVAGLIDQLPP